MKSRILSLLILATLATAGCGETTSAPPTPGPSTSESALAMGPWEPVAGLEGGNLRQLAVTPESVYALGNAGIFSVDTDADVFTLLADNATLHNVGLDVNLSPLAAPSFEFLFHSGVHDSLYAVVGGELFQRSDDQWNASGEAAHSLLELEGTLYLRRQGEILTSSDGTHWTSLTAIPSETSGIVCCLGRLVGDPVRERLYLLNNKGVFFYSLSSQTWTAMDVGDDLFEGPLTSLQTLFVDPSNGDVYVGTIFDLYVSTDGQSWSPPLFKQQTGAWGTPVASITRSDIDGTLYVATNGGVYSRVGTGNLTALPDLDAVANEISFHDGRLWAATSSGLWSYRTASGWEQTGSKGLLTKNIRALVMEDRQLKAQTDEVFSQPRYEGDDVLANFHTVYTLQASGEWAFDKLYPGLDTPPLPYKDLELGLTIFAKVSIEGLNLRVAATQSGVFYSLKNGPWKIWNEGLPTFRITTLVYDPESNRLYAGTTGHGVLQLQLLTGL